MVLDIHQEQASARRRRCMKESLKIRATGNRQARDQGSQRSGRICLEKRLHDLSLVLQCSGAVVALFNAKVGGSTTHLCLQECLLGNPIIAAARLARYALTPVNTGLRRTANVAAFPPYTKPEGLYSLDSLSKAHWHSIACSQASRGDVEYPDYLRYREQRRIDSGQYASTQNCTSTGQRTSTDARMPCSVYIHLVTG